MARSTWQSVLPNDGPATSRADFITLAKQKLKIDEKYEKAYWEFRKSVKPLDLPKFWKMVSVLKDLVFERKGDQDPAENAVDEFFRLAHVGDAEYTLADCVAFSVRWDKLYLEDALFDIIEGKSDDSYHDLLDSLPFAGEKFMLRCQRSGFEDCKEFMQDLKKTVGYWWYEYIYEGENFISLKLDDEVKDRIPNALSRQ